MANKDSLYIKLYNSLLDSINSMKPGERMPSERTLCDEYKLSRTTVRNAISELESNGYVSRVQGKGTFVRAQDLLKHNLSDYYSFTDQIRSLGKTPKSEILDFHIKKANSETAKNLNISEDELVIRFVRLRKSNDTPMMLETTYLKYEDFTELTKVHLEQKPLYEIFENDYNRNIYKVNEMFSVSLLNSETSKLLGVKNKEPCLAITRISTDEDENIIEYTTSLARSDKFVYQTEYYPK
ncbi:GntR family transcriptional regulator [Microaceticoccus formicicus]|uniref:GntR family transcriptional regulator n=1 Tax=Microaceticoccus formicicus TaxID=3118105 RepID=UPI003CD01E98|nr:GntR family transcriptional regulator [Peptoniphilaceae bacterium AMB_02]